MKKRKIEVPLQNGKELKPIMIKPNMGRIIKPMAKFPDLSGDGKVTQKDILIGRGVIDKPKMKKGKHSLGKDLVAEYAKKGISEKVLNTFGTTKSDTVTVKKRGHSGINPRVGAALKLSGKSSGNVRLGPLGKNSKEIMTRGEGKKEKVAYAMGDRTYTQDNKNELKNKVNMKKPKMKNKKDTPKRLQIKKTGRNLQNALNKELSKPVTKQDKRVIIQLRGAIEEKKKQLKTNKTKPTMKKPKMKKPMLKKAKMKKPMLKKPKMNYKKKK